MKKPIRLHCANPSVIFSYNVRAHVKYNFDVTLNLIISLGRKSVCSQNASQVT